MDKLSCSRNETSESSKPAKLSEKKGRSNIHEDFINLSSQVHIMSESVAACPMFSKPRSLRKDSSAFDQRKWLAKDVMHFYANGGKNDMVVNYMMKDKDFLHLRKSKTFISREEILMRGYSEESLYSGSIVSRDLRSKSSKIGMYDYRKVDSGKLIDLLQRELKALAALNPSVTLIVMTLTENLSHCQECRRCHEKISTSLPWILNRVQKLIKYVSTQRKETYIWPNDSSYLRVNFSKSSLGSASSSKITLIPFASPKLLGKLEKIDPIALSEDSPGVQLLLEVKPDLEKKKFFYPVNTEIQSSECHPTYPVVHLKEHKSVPVVHVLTSAPKPILLWKEKREVALTRGFGVAIRAFYIFCPRIPASVTVAVGKLPLIRKSAARKQENNLLKVLIEEKEWNVGQLPYSVFKEKTNDRETFLEKFRTSYSKLVRDLLSEAEQEKMEAQKVNELEEEVKELKDLMLEVHKNQTELGKLLLEKKVFSQLMVKLTDPKMLEEENKALKKASKPSTSSSTIALQMKVDSLKRKCSLKNRLIMTLLKGLRSNVPKELWEEVVTYAFEDSESMDDFDSEKINEFIRQTSLLLTNEEKERKLAPATSRLELQSAEEEPKMKGIMGAEVEDNLKNLSCYESHASTKSNGFEGSQARIWAFPVLNVPEYTDTVLRKLENQISILNMENERLWHQVNELRELLKNSVNEMNMFEFDRKISSVKTSGKTINLVIQIAEKEARRSKEVAIPETRSKSSPAVKIAQSESVTAIHEAEAEKVPESERKLSLITSGQNVGRSRSDSRRSENDLSYLDDVNYDSKQESKRAALRDKIYSNNGQESLMKTPHPSAHEMHQNLKPVIWVPSKHVIPEVSDLAGPSRKQVELTNLLQKPSLMELVEIQCGGMYTTMSNERELQTIPENDPDSSLASSRGVSQAIQRLRTRVRSLHKDMTVLRSKNDRIDKLLERLMDDVVENNHNYEELENSLSSLKSRLG